MIVQMSVFYINNVSEEEVGFMFYLYMSSLIMFLIMFFLMMGNILQSRGILKSILKYNEDVAVASKRGAGLIVLGDKCRSERMKHLVTIEKLVNYFVVKFIVFILLDIIVTSLVVINDILFYVGVIVVYLCLLLMERELETTSPFVDIIYKVVFFEYIEYVLLAMFIVILSLLYIFFRYSLNDFFIYCIFVFFLVSIASAIRTWYARETWVLLLIYIIILVLLIVLTFMIHDISNDLPKVDI